jgi:hypothetical protein
MNLAELASKIWSRNLQIMFLLMQMQSIAPNIDVHHTWFQEPIRFEDAFGREIPIPSEYNWSVSVKAHPMKD